MKEFNDSPPAPLTIDAETLTAGLLTEVSSLVAELHPRQSRAKPATLDSSLDRDLGLDSLARVELLARIEKRFCLSLPERVYADAETVRDLMRAIRGAGSAKSTCAPVEIVPVEPADEIPAPHHAQTLIDVLNWHAWNHADRAHIRLYSDDHEGEVLSYQQLSDGATLVAAGLQHRGLQLGEPVVIMLPTGLDYFRAFFGVLLAGGIPVPIYPPARMSQIEDHLRRHQAIVANCGAVTLITVPEAKPLARLLKSLVASLQHLVTAADLSAEARPYYKPTLAGHGTALLQYTSGSTGNPKGVILTHANLLANMRAMGDAVQVQSNDVFVSWLPLYHDMGLIGRAAERHSRGGAGGRGRLRGAVPRPDAAAPRRAARPALPPDRPRTDAHLRVRHRPAVAPPRDGSAVGGGRPLGLHERDLAAGGPHDRPRRRHHGHDSEDKPARRLRADDQPAPRVQPRARRVRVHRVEVWVKEGLRQFLFSLRKSVIGGGEDAYEEALKLSPEEFDLEFEKYLKNRFKPFHDKNDQSYG